MKENFRPPFSGGERLRLQIAHPNDSSRVATTRDDHGRNDTCLLCPFFSPSDPEYHGAGATNGETVFSSENERVSGRLDQRYHTRKIQTGNLSLTFTFFKRWAFSSPRGGSASSEKKNKHHPKKKKLTIFTDSLVSFLTSRLSSTSLFFFFTTRSSGFTLLETTPTVLGCFCNWLKATDYTAGGTQHGKGEGVYF